MKKLFILFFIYSIFSLSGCLSINSDYIGLSESQIIQQLGDPEYNRQKEITIESELFEYEPDYSIFFPQILNGESIEIKQIAWQQFYIKKISWLSFDNNLNKWIVFDYLEWNTLFTNY